MSPKEQSFFLFPYAHSMSSSLEKVAGANGHNKYHIYDTEFITVGFIEKGLKPS